MYIVYILLCQDKSLYTGITNNLEKRLRAHRDGKGSKYVSSRLPVELIYQEVLENKSEALKRELEIKRWSKEKKIRILKLEKYL